MNQTFLRRKDMSRNQILGWALALLVLGSAGEALAVSQAGAIHLTFPIGARYNGMGESGTALADDAAALWWNPGGFAFAADDGYDWDLEVMQSPLAAGLANDVNLYWLGGGKYVDGWGMFGFPSAPLLLPVPGRMLSEQPLAGLACSLTGETESRT